MAVFALVDCNNFYTSCEKLFDPKLAGRPVVVLSNNDGCVVARSAEAKTLGVPMGAPWFKLQALARREGIIAFSSNYALYADMSNRVMEVLKQFSPSQEVYSIDESFLELSGVSTGCSLHDYGTSIRSTIASWLGLTVCVGIGPTKTLAKLANHCAKKALAGHEGVCDLTVMSPRELAGLMERIPVEQTWGVGRQLASQLREAGIFTVLHLRDADARFLRSRFSVVLERTARELRGLSCLHLEEDTPPRQQILTSRSFGQAICTLEELKKAMAGFVVRAAEKLRSQNCLAGIVQVSVRTNPFKPNEPQYQRSIAAPLPQPTADSSSLCCFALILLEDIFKPGYSYKKAGVLLDGLQPRDVLQRNLFAEEGEAQRQDALMDVMDRINARWGRGTMRLCAEGSATSGRTQRGLLSPRYTTAWDGLPEVRA